MISLTRPWRGSTFDEAELFRAIANSGARALLIGRRALIAHGMPVLTADYDFWVRPDDAQLLNDALEPLGFTPSFSAEEARHRGRYRLENDEIVDVLLRARVSMTTGGTLAFDDVWLRRELLEVAAGVDAALPCLEDLADTKRFGARQKDLEDLRFIEVLLGKRKS
jgi:hypothetical protein